VRRRSLSFGDAIAERAARERRLVLVAKDHGPAERGELVDAFLPLIVSTARIYRGSAIARPELVQAGVVGLLRALERFDPALGTPFWAYASWWVRQAMQQLVSELSRPVVLSDRALRNLARLKQAHFEALQHSGKEPSRHELAERTGLTLEQVDDVMAADRAPRGLEEPLVGPDGDIGTFGDLLVDPLAEDQYERVLSAIEVEALHGLLAGLSERERRILRARYGLDGEERTLREIGEELGLSGERVRQLERRALGKLAADMSAGREVSQP
jgi:RNA polymerase sigma factor (sigma-70 family)